MDSHIYLDSPTIEIVCLSDDVRKALFNVAKKARESFVGIDLWKEIEPIARTSSLTVQSILRDILRDNWYANPFISILRIAARFEVNRILVEKPYLDLEFWETYSHLYSKTFSVIHRNSLRMHFFKTAPEILVDGLLEYLQGMTDENTNFKYYGFAIIRPIPKFKIGRTALAFDSRAGKEVERLNLGLTDDLDTKTIPFCSTVITQKANVLNRKMVIDSVPFMQQDPAIGVCASTSAWVCSEVIAEKFNLSRFPYWEISRFAFDNQLDFREGKEYIRGLNLAEIRRAVGRTGANPLFIMGGDGATQKIKNYLFTFVDSNIPCIVCLAKKGESFGHTVAAISYALPQLSGTGISLSAPAKDYTCESDVPNQYFLSSFAERFYVHDDSYGPFNRLSIIGESAQLGRVSYKKQTSNFVSRMITKYSKSSTDNIDDNTYEITALIAPLPPYIKCSPEAVANTCVQVMQDIFWPIISKFYVNGVTVLWRILAVEATAFKQSLKFRNYTPNIRRLYSQIHMSKYIWLAEYTLVQKQSSTLPDSAILGDDRLRDIDGEFIFDASFPAYSTRSISFRLSHLLTTERLEQYGESDKLFEALKSGATEDAPTTGPQKCFSHCMLSSKP